MSIYKLPDATDLEFLRRRMSTQFQIPSAYDDALSYQGLIYKLIQYLKDTMQNVEDWNVWLEDFVNTFDTKLQDNVRGMIQELYDNGQLAELTAQVIDVVQDQINGLTAHVTQIAVPITEFPRLSGEVDDSKRFERAVNSEYSHIILERDASYEIDTAHFYTGNVTLHGNNATIHAKTDTSVVFLVGRNNVNDPVSVKELVIKNINFVGKQTTWEGADGSAGIHIAGNVYERNGGSSNIVIENCKFSKFTVAIMADGVTNLLVNRIYSTNHYFKDLAASGGYGVLLHSCYEVVIKESQFIGVAGDRHAIYISNAVGSDVANENITIRDNVVNWENTYPINGMESSINSRSVKGLTIDNNEIIDGFGGIHLNPSGGDVQDVVIINNRIRNRSNLPNYRGAISFYANATFKAQHCLIRGNRIECTTQNANGIELNSVSFVQIVNNDMFVTGVATRGITVVNCSDLIIDGNAIRTDNSFQGINYAGTNANITIGANDFEGFVSNEVSANDIENIKHNTIRSVVFESLGTGYSGISMAYSDKNMLVSTWSQLLAGVRIVMNKLSNKPYRIQVTNLLADGFNYSVAEREEADEFYVNIRNELNESVSIYNAVCKFRLDVLR